MTREEYFNLPLAPYNSNRQPKSIMKLNCSMEQLMLSKFGFIYAPFNDGYKIQKIKFNSQ